MVNNHIKAVSAQKGRQAHKTRLIRTKKDDNRTKRRCIRTKGMTSAQNAARSAQNKTPKCYQIQHLGVFSISEMIIVFRNNNALWIVWLDMDESDCMGVNI